MVSHWCLVNPTRYILTADDGYLIAAVYQPATHQHQCCKEAWVAQILNYTAVPRYYVKPESAMRAAEREAKKTIRRLNGWASKK